MHLAIDAVDWLTAETNLAPRNIIDHTDALEGRRRLEEHHSDARQGL